MKKAIIIVGILICIVASTLIVNNILNGHDVPIKEIVIGGEHNEGGSYTYYYFKRNKIKQVFSDSGLLVYKHTNYYNYTDTMLDLLDELKVKIEQNDIYEEVTTQTGVVAFKEECKVTLKNGEIKEISPNNKTIVKILDEIMKVTLK